MLAQMGYDGLFLGRIDYEDKLNRFVNKNTEMIWKASDSLGSSSNLFTSILYDGYSSPSGFCFDVLCSEEPVVDDKNSPEYNVDLKVIEIKTHKQANKQKAGVLKQTLSRLKYLMIYEIVCSTDKYGLTRGRKVRKQTKQNKSQVK